MNELQVIEQKTIPFDGTELMAVKMSDDKIYVAVVKDLAIAHQVNVEGLGA